MQLCSSSIIYVSNAYLSTSFSSSSTLYNASIYIYDSHNHSYLWRKFPSLMCKRLLDIILDIIECLTDDGTFCMFIDVSWI